MWPSYTTFLTPWLHLTFSIVEVKHPWSSTWKINFSALSTRGSVTFLQSSSEGSTVVNIHPQAASNMRWPMETTGINIPINIPFKQNLPNMMRSTHSSQSWNSCFILYPSSVFSYPPRRKHSPSTNTLPACIWPITFKFSSCKLKTAWKYFKTSDVENPSRV